MKSKWFCALRYEKIRVHHTRPRPSKLRFLFGLTVDARVQVDAATTGATQLVMEHHIFKEAEQSAIGGPVGRKITSAYAHTPHEVIPYDDTSQK